VNTSFILKQHLYTEQRIMLVMTKQNVTISMCLQTVLYNVLLEIRAQHLETTAELVSKLRPECEYILNTEFVYRTK